MNNMPYSLTTLSAKYEKRASISVGAKYTFK